jgi:hypothetical protein
MPRFDVAGRRDAAWRVPVPGHAESGCQGSWIGGCGRKKAEAGSVDGDRGVVIGDRHVAAHGAGC